jgi:hypothetical protein
MAFLRTLRSGATALALLSAVLLGGCVDSFGGSNIQVTLDMGVPVPADEGDTPSLGQAPHDTYLAFWVVKNVYQTDDDGEFVLDNDGNRIIDSSFAFELERFFLQPVINQESPCFIDADLDSRYPGIHVTMFASRVHRDTGIGDPLALGTDHGFPEGDVIDVLTADVRHDNLLKLETGVKAATSYSPLEYPDTATECIEDNASVDPTLIPPANCIEDESNANRLAACQTFWDEDELFYEGSDKVFTLPLNGKWRGAVTGTNPVSGISLIGGANFFVDEVVQDFDSMMINWQFTDHNEDGEPDYPDGFPDEDKSSVGFHFMSGTPIDKTRGVINVPLINRTFGQIGGEAVIFPKLNEDNVQF